MKKAAEEAEKKKDSHAGRRRQEVPDTRTFQQDSNLEDTSWEKQDNIPDRWDEKLTPNIPKKTIAKVRKPLKIMKWFGFDSESDNTDDSDSTEWTEVDRKTKQEEKRKRQRKKKKDLEEATATRAASMIGIGPVNLNRLDENRKANMDFETSKIKIVKDILAEELDYDPEELEELDIVETKLSTKGDGMIYVALPNKDQLREIHVRKAELQNDHIIIRNYIPPSFFERFTYLNKISKDKRSEDPSLRTLVRFGRKYLEIFVKTKGEESPFRNIKIEDFTEIKDVPSFDHSIKWRRTVDKPPRRRMRRQSTEVSDNTRDPTKRKNNLNSENRTNPLIRQLSKDGRPEQDNKKKKMDSSSEEDDAEDMEDEYSDTDRNEDPARGKKYPSAK